VRQVFHFRNHGVGKEIVHGHFGGITGEARTEMPAWLGRGAAGSQRDVYFRILTQKLVAHLHDGGLWGDDLQVLEKYRGDHLIDQDAPVLGVFYEFDDVEITIVGFDEMSLRAAAHLSKEAHRIYGHTNELPWNFDFPGGEILNMPEDNEVPVPVSTPPAGPGRSKDEVALDLMKFIAVTTGYGKSVTTTGFTGKQGTRTPEEHADALLQLFERCRTAVLK